MTPTIHEMKSAYDKHKHLKIAADSIGMKWQTLYWHLKKSGHPIQGDKESYGSEKDKFAAASGGFIFNWHLKKPQAADLGGLFNP